jgi:hypothetical protein
MVDRVHALTVRAATWQATTRLVDQLNQLRSEPTPKPAGLHLNKRLRLSLDRGPPQQALRSHYFDSLGLSRLYVSAQA